MTETRIDSLSVVVRCLRCNATLEISTDDRRRAERAAEAFRKRHRCAPGRCPSPVPCGLQARTP